MRDGYVYRIDRDRGLINGLFPMFENDGDFYTIGQRYPLDYGFYNVPTQYQFAIMPTMTTISIATAMAGFIRSTARAA